eukprot:9489376-Pyramimonas_sp.AAC.1
MPTIEYAVEIDHEKKAELRLSPHAPRCMFSDYEDFWKVEIKSTINRLKSDGQKVSLTCNVECVPVFILVGSFRRLCLVCPCWCLGNLGAETHPLKSRGSCVDLDRAC